MQNMEKVTNLVHNCLALEKEKSEEVGVDKKFHYRLFLEGFV